MVNGIIDMGINYSHINGGNVKYEDRELLDRIIHFYHTRLFDDQRIQAYLKKIGLYSQETCINFKLGFSGNLAAALPDDQETFNKLKRLGILDDNLNETLSESLIVPIRSEGKTFASVMGVSLADNKEKFLPGNEALFNIEALKASKEIYLTDSILNALLLYSIGLRETAGLIGDTLNDAHLKIFEKYQTKSVTLLVANHNLQKFSKKIKSQGIAVGYIDIESSSLSRLVVEGLKRDYCLSLVKEPKIDMAEPIIEERGEEIFYEFEDRRYRVRRLDPFRLDCLRINLKATHQGLWHLDTIDLYAERQRRNFVTMARKLIRLDQGFLFQDLLRITDDLEDRQAKIILEKKEKFQDMLPHEKDEAMKFLRSDDITSEILKDFSDLGIVGEETNVLTGYLSLISRKLTHPLSIMLVGGVSSQKDAIKDALLDTVPEQDLERFTKLSPQVLFYRDELSLKNRMLVIDDEGSLKELDYILASLQNRGLSYSVTHKSPETGKLRSHDYKVKGPVSIMVSASDPKIIKKLSSHFLILRMEESLDQTKKVLLQQRDDETLRGILREKKAENIKRKHRNSQRLLKPYTIINPYVKEIECSDETKGAAIFQPRYLSLIKAVCLLRQYHKEVKRFQETEAEYIEVDSLDIEIANNLMKAVVRMNCQLRSETLEILRGIEEFIREKAAAHKISKEGATFTRKDLMAFSHITDNEVRGVLKELVEAKYVELIAGSNGKTMEYRLKLDLVEPCEFKVTR